MNQLCTFRLDGFHFAVEVARVREVLRFQETTCVPLAPGIVEGLINLRGQIVTAVDLRQRLELGPRPREARPMNVVVQAGGAQVSLLVDEIGDVVEVADTAFEEPPENLGGVARELIRGAYKLDGRLLLLLDADRAVSLDQVA